MSTQPRGRVGRPSSKRSRGHPSLKRQWFSSPSASRGTGSRSIDCDRHLSKIVRLSEGVHHDLVKIKEERGMWSLDAVIANAYREVSCNLIILSSHFRHKMNKT